MAAPETSADRSPSDLESEMEATRQRLEVTIDQLLHRASPKTIVQRQVADVKGYFVAPDGSPRTDNILKVAGGFVGFVGVMLIVRRVAR